MLNPVRSNAFKRDVKRMLKRGKSGDKLHAVIAKLIHEELLSAEYRDHKLHGTYEGRRECHIEPDWVLIYKVISNDIIFERTGSHSDLLE